MDTATHDLNTLFDQLGLASSDPDIEDFIHQHGGTLTDSCLLYTSPSPRDNRVSRMPSSA